MNKAIITKRKTKRRNPQIQNLTQSRYADPKRQSSLSLAFLGDAVYGLLVREYLIGQGVVQVHALHIKSIEFVKASSQSKAAGLVLPLLTEEETAVFRRGRNAHLSAAPKGGDMAEYRRASGLEALFGYLYLCGNIERVNFLFSLICGSKEGQ